MAENKKTNPEKKDEEKGKQTETGETKGEEKQDGAQKKPFPLKLVIIVAAALVVAGGLFFGWQKMKATKKNKGQVVAVKAPATDKVEMGATYTMETFIVNLLDPNGRRYLKIQIILELDQETLKLEIDKRMPQFKDAMITLLSSKTHTEIATLEGKMQLRSELLAMFNQFLKTGKIINLYLMDFIIQ